MANLKMTYKEAIAETERILSDISSEKTDIDELAKSVKRVAELLDYCKTKLTKTELEIAKIFEEPEV